MLVRQGVMLVRRGVSASETGCLFMLVRQGVYASETGCFC